MTETVKLSPLDVVSIDKNKSPINATTFKVLELVGYAASKICNGFAVEIATQWAAFGIPCEVLLRNGQDWQSGKVRLSLEFIPDPEEDEDEEENLTEESVKALSESPLDDLRAELLNDS